MLEYITHYLNFNDKNLWLTVALVVWTPLFWNVLCRYEYRTGTFSKLFGSPHRACVILSFSQIFFSNVRNYYCIASQAMWNSPYNPLLLRIGQAMIVVGMVLVVSSFYQLGWTGTWHGDHFGILLPAKVTAFPFSILDHPMYVGAELNFLGMSLGRCSFAGLVLTVWVHIVYQVTEMYEGPFTEMIYSKRETKAN